MALADLFKRDESFCTLCLRQPGVAHLQRCTLDEIHAYTTILEVPATSPFLCGWCAGPLRRIGRLRQRARRAQAWLRAYYTFDELPESQETSLLTELKEIQDIDLKYASYAVMALAELSAFEDKTENEPPSTFVEETQSDHLKTEELSIDSDDTKIILERENDVKLENEEMHELSPCNMQNLQVVHHPLAAAEDFFKVELENNFDDTSLDTNFPAAQDTNVNFLPCTDPSSDRNGNADTMSPTIPSIPTSNVIQCAGSVRDSTASIGITSHFKKSNSSVKEVPITTVPARLGSEITQLAREMKIQLLNRLAEQGPLDLEDLINERVINKPTQASHKEEPTNAPKAMKVDLKSLLLAGTPTPCARCGQMFVNESQLAMHMREVHERESIQAKQRLSVHNCVHCGQYFTMEKDLALHICSQMTACNQPTRKPRSEKKTVQKVACAACGEMMDAPELSAHACLHESYACKECGKEFRLKGALTRHENNVHAKLSVKCPECPKMVIKARLARHVQSHQSDNLLCPLCPSSLKNKNSLAQHMTLRHSGDGTQSLRRECPVCGKPVTTLTTHMRTHESPALRFVCDACGKTFKRRETMRVHFKMHADDSTQFECHDCGKRFMYKSKIIAHIRDVHLPWRMVKCKVCGKRVKDNRLRVHVKRIHERPPHQYVCQQCGRRFASHRNLQCHEATHRDERPFVCAQCGATFKHSGALWTHTQMKHAGITWRQLRERRRWRREAKTSGKRADQEV